MRETAGTGSGGVAALNHRLMSVIPPGWEQVTSILHIPFNELDIMKRTLPLLVALILCAASSVYALYDVANEGLWPKDWPAELEPLRKQSRTLVGPEVEYQHFAIPFATREEFEAAWPHILEVKSKGAPIVLRRGPSFWFDDKTQVGVCIHTPPEGVNRKVSPEEPIAAYPTTNISRWMNMNYIELITDGSIVDLNRISFPADTPIIDERFPSDDTK
jgi:hypothetical protein